ncbi:MAG: helix-turn-helix domain-containing protein [Lachnospiraceae bacterium]|nr:helix-turn-helix domain-containing protein [Lachnospiraceae bacterium]
MSVTKNIANYIDSIGVNLSELSRKSGVDYSALYASLKNKERERELRADELTSICTVLKIDPMDFADKPKEQRRE